MTYADPGPGASAADRAADLIQERIAPAIAEVKPLLRGWLHAGAAPVALLSILTVLTLADTTRARVGIAVYLVSATMLFTTSAIYHTGAWSAPRTRLLKRIDHANIYVLIAGSTTPFALLLLSAEHAVILLSVMWVGALAGAVFRICWVDAPRRVNVILCLILGWTPVLFARDFLDQGFDAALTFLAVGGLLYSAGAVVYGTQRPDPIPSVFGYHEVFHALTIAAFGAHVLAIALLVTASQ